MKCKGCGVELQDQFENEIGYTPDLNKGYCQRCFRLSHYGDVMYSLKQGIPADKVLTSLQHEQGILAWVVDLFDFESGFIPDFNEVFKDRTIILVVTKSDLLMNVLTPEKCIEFIQSRCKALHIHYDGLIVNGIYGKEEALEIKHALKHYAKGHKVIVAGKANAGKSTFLNSLMGTDALTTSRYPGTTIDFNPLVIDDELTIIDTPGIEGSYSMIMEVEEKDLKTVCPFVPIKPSVYQAYSDQMYAIGGLVRLDLIGVKKASFVTYISNRIKIHRSNYNSGDAMWKKHKGSLFAPSVKGDYKLVEYGPFKDKSDIVIHGLGWITLSGNYEKIRLHVPKNVYVTVRKAMI